MAGGASWWIRGSVDPSKLGNWRDVEVEGAWTRVDNDDAPPRELMQQLSAKTDAVWVAAKDERFEYVHYRGGKLVRELAFGSRGVWDVATGKKQPWEPWPAAKKGAPSPLDGESIAEVALQELAIHVAHAREGCEAVLFVKKRGRYIRVDVAAPADSSALDAPASVATASRGGEAVWLAAYRPADDLVVACYRDGKCVRDLAYGIGEQWHWTRVAGTPQPWEAWDDPPALGEIDAIDAGEAFDAIVQRLKAR